VQFFFRGDDNLAVIDSRRRLAAQRDTIPDQGRAPCDESLFDPKRPSTTAVAIRQDGGKLRLLHILVERRAKKI
jgi:hypothetical protein